MKSNIKTKKSISINAIAYRLTKKKIKRITKGILTISLLLVVLSSFSFVNPPNENEEALSIENLKELLIEEGVLFPDIVLRQAIQETGWFKCDNCSLEKNNIFGFYYKKKYISYDNWQDCVRYYKRWQGRHYKGGDYYAFLKKVGFATDPAYAKKLKAIKVK
jgi:hypothetical protein